MARALYTKTCAQNLRAITFLYGCIFHSHLLFSHCDFHREKFAKSVVHKIIMDISECVSIDLYADDGDTAFVEDYKENDVDIYEDVILSTSDENILAGRENSPSEKQQVEDNVKVRSSDFTGRRHQLYVGNLTWWTKDQDVHDAILDLGVNDCVEVKFFENRINGQSKGFCVVSLLSEDSARICLEQLPSKDLYGRRPMVTHPTKQALTMFESQTRTRTAPTNSMKLFNGNSSTLYSPMQRLPTNYLMMPPPPTYIYPYNRRFSRPDVRFNVPPAGNIWGCLPNGKQYINQPNSIPPEDPYLMVSTEWIDEEASYAEAIYEKILHNNRKISSTAIARAVSETASGDFRSAIDTLQTALALIRDSQTADDDRCRIIISSLQDTLNSVEKKASERHSSRTRDRHHESHDSPDRYCFFFNFFVCKVILMKLECLFVIKLVVYDIVP